MGLGVQPWEVALVAGVSEAGLPSFLLDVSEQNKCCFQS